MKRRVGERGQVTIPKRFREELGIQAGDYLEFEAEDGRLIVRRLPVEDPLHRLVGLIKEKVDVDAYLAETRGPAYDPALDPEGPLDEEIEIE